MKPKYKIYSIKIYPTNLAILYEGLDDPADHGRYDLDFDGCAGIFTRAEWVESWADDCFLSKISEEDQEKILNNLENTSNTDFFAGPNGEEVILTQSEIKAGSLSDPAYWEGQKIYMSGERWSEDIFGTLADWKKEIPENEADAATSGYYNWYLDYNQKFDVITWSEYRALLFFWLKEVDIVIINDI